MKTTGVSKMEKEYNFDDGIVGKFYRPNKVQKTIRFDQDVIEFFQKEALKNNIGYQTLINQTLRDSMEHPQGLVDIEVLRSELKSIVHEEFKHSKSA